MSAPRRRGPGHTRTRGASRAHAPLLAALAALVACRGEPLDALWCADAAADLPAAPADLTWHAEIAPIVAQKCLRCHDTGAHSGVALETYADVVAASAQVRAAVADRRMPPWLAADCRTPLYEDFDLTDTERAALIAWIDGGLAEGDADAPGESLPPIGGLSRVDVTVTMPEPYTPHPEHGIDETRCFLLDWPLDTDTQITGLAPRPGAREIVHHLIVASVGPEDIDAIEARDAQDAGPGFACEGGVGEFPTVTPLGGSLVGGDYPRGIGKPMGAGGALLLQMHYSLPVDLPVADQTAIDFRVDDDAVEAGGIVIANAAWLVGEAMRVPAGASDEGYWYQFDPLLFTGGNPVDLQGVTPHMHRYASRMRVHAVHPDGSSTCLLEIPDWDFGWEQPYWFDTPVRFAPEDALYLECRFDNSAANQPEGGAPRDIAWGEDDQDMCVAFLSFTTAAP